MAVRFEVEITSGQTVAVAVAIANSGYEAESPEIVVPISFAVEKLKIKSRGKKEKFITAGRREVEFRVLGPVSIAVAAPGRAAPVVHATLIAAEKENEVILNDALVDALGVQLVHLKKGTWRFFDDAPDLERPSAARRLY